MDLLGDERMVQIALSEPSLLNEISDSTYFENLHSEFQEIIVKCADYYEEYGEYPKWENLGKYKDLFVDNISDADKQEFRRTLNEEDSLNLRIRLSDAIQEEKISTHQDVLDLLEKINKPKDDNLNDVKKIDTLEQVKSLYLERKHRFDNAVSTGLEGLNYLLGSNGWIPQNIYAFQGPNGVGKSIWLINVALQAYLSGKKVFYITLEMPIIEQYERFIRAATKSHTFEQAILKEKEIETFFNNSGEIRWLDRAPKELSSSSIEECIDNRLPWKPDLVVVDYIDEMSTNNIKEKFNAEYERLEIVSGELFALAKKKEIPIVTATQANKSSLNQEGTGTKEYANMSQTADSFNMLQKFSGVFGIIKDDAKSHITMSLQNIKSRHGQNYLKRDFIFSPNTLRIGDPGPARKDEDKSDEEKRDDVLRQWATKLINESPKTVNEELKDLVQRKEIDTNEKIIIAKYVSRMRKENENEREKHKARKLLSKKERDSE